MKINFLFYRILLSVLIPIFFNSVDAQPNIKIGTYQYAVFENNDKTFGYSIIQNNKVVIKQSIIPTIQGKKGFASKKDAEKIAQLVVKKLSKKGGLPTISREELIKQKIKI